MSKVVGVVGRSCLRFATPRVRDLGVSVLSVLVWVGGPIAGWLLVVESVHKFGVFEVAAWAGLFAGVVWFVEAAHAVRSRWR